MYRSYPVAMTPHQDGSFGVVIPDLPGFSSVVHSFELGRVQAKDAIEQHLEGILKQGEVIPETVELAEHQMSSEFSDAFWVWVVIEVFDRKLPGWSFV